MRCFVSSREADVPEGGCERGLPRARVVDGPSLAVRPSVAHHEKGMMTRTETALMIRTPSRC